MSHHMRKPAICMGKNKGADQLRSNCEADQRLCFRYSDSTIPLLSKSSILNPKFPASSHLLWLHRPICVRPGRNPNCWFSHAQAHIILIYQTLPLSSRYLESAEMYAQTQNSFEEVALKFIRLDDKDALRKFLHKKLESLRVQVSDYSWFVLWFNPYLTNEFSHHYQLGGST